MRLESLAIIFVIIIIPISIVLSEYIDNKITIAETELQYNTKVFNSAQDGITAFQLNNINNSYSDISTLKVEDIESSANSFLNSLAINFGYTGYKTRTMQEYVPAVVFTLYDGYYIYAPFVNTLTSTKDAKLDDTNVDDSYKNGKTLYGLKPYVYYSCRYKKNENNDFIVTYTLDNYITVQGIVNGDYVYKYGYLINVNGSKGALKKENDNTYTYRGITISSSDTETETLKENVSYYDASGQVQKKDYPYAKINGIKYYLEDNDKIFYIDEEGYKNYNQFAGNDEYKEKLRKAITNNKSAYEYYRDAYAFTDWVNTNLSSIKTSDAITTDASENTASISEYSKFGDYNIFGTDIDYEKSNSLFNEHRKNVIRYVVETNLSTSIAAFSLKAGGTDFVMPKISETDWDIIENDVCLIGFVQGLNIGTKRYNGYAVVPNNRTKEYIDENDIYIIKNDNGNNYYYKANDENLIKDNTLQEKTNGYYSGIWKLNFEYKKYIDNDRTITYYPYDALASYTSIVGTSGLRETGITGSSQYTDMYDYMVKKGSDNLKKVYFKALARERWGSYHVNNDLDLKYFLDSY